jgi:hypothetical protein
VRPEPTRRDADARGVEGALAVAAEQELKRAGY